MLDGVEPPIWRWLSVPGDITLERLHEVLQVAMGWMNSHLHQFKVGAARYGIPDGETDGDLETKDERRYILAQIVKDKEAKFVYQYDFGDSWEHLILVENIQPSDGKSSLPLCLDGARNCPPEDVGSVPGYEEFLKAITDPKHPEHKDQLNWVGGSFDPEAFSVDAVNKELKRLHKAGGLETLWPLEEE